MTDDAPRRYDDQEFALILRHAASLSERDPALRTDGADGITLEEMQAAAREAGLDPDAVARAAALVPQRAPTGAGRLLGGPVVIQMEYTARGRITDDGMVEAIDVIRRVTRHQGSVTEAFGGIEWRSVGWASQVCVTVTPQQDATAVRLLADRGGAALLTYFVPTLAGLLTFAITGAVTEPTGIAAIGGLFAGSVGTGLLAARAIWARGSRRFRQMMTHLMTDVSAAVNRRTEDTSG